MLSGGLKNAEADNTGVLVLQHELAGAYQADGQVGKAVELLKLVVAVDARVLRDGHPSRLVSQTALAAIYAELTSNCQVQYDHPASRRQHATGSFGRLYIRL